MNILNKNIILKHNITDKMGKHSNSQLCTDANKTLKILVLGDNNVGKSGKVA